MDKFEIYKISNDVNDKVYIGQTYKGIKDRFEEHSAAPYAIGDAIRAIGKEHFKIETLEETEDYYEALEIEKKYILKYDSIENGYNSRLPCKGRIPSGIGFVYREIKIPISDYKKAGMIAQGSNKTTDEVISEMISLGLKKAPEKELEEVRFYENLVKFANDIIDYALKKINI